MSRSDTDNYLDLFLKDRPLMDTRAPVEFSRGAFPQASNLPLMSDEERHLVGIRYKQQGQDAAIALGRELVSPALQAQRTAAWITFARENPDGFLYCFRGGLRSRITQQWMDEAGNPYPCVKGGYKAMRRFLIDRIEKDVSRARFILISGRTGTGKTLLLNRIQRSIDLEGLANHRGSSFGPMARPQPSPIDYENMVAIALLKLVESDATSPIFIEAEGRQVGSLSVPPVLWEAMSRAPTLVLDASLDRRIGIGIQDYVVDLLSQIQATHPGEEGFNLFADRHRHSLSKIRKRLGGDHYKTATKRLEKAISLHRTKNDISGYRPFVSLLLEKYYDPMYDYQLSQRHSEVLMRGDEEALLRWLEARHIVLS